MKPSRIALAAAAAATLVTSLVSAGTAADAASTNSHSKRVCAHAATGYVACDARVRTDANLKPLATQGPTGYRPAQLRGGVRHHGDRVRTTTVAIVDAYAHPNAAADLAAYRDAFGLGTRQPHPDEPERRLDRHASRQHRLGPGGDARPRDGLGHLPGLPDPLRRRELRVVHRPRDCREPRPRRAPRSSATPTAATSSAARPRCQLLQPPGRHDHGKHR